jgi:hypothetical protein
VRREWEPEDLVACWTLVEADWELLANKTGATRLGFASLLKFFELEGRRDLVDRQDVPEVAIRHRQVRMTELALNHVHRHPLGRQLGSVGMPERMRVDPLLDAGLPCQPRQELPYVRGVERRPVERAEQRPCSDAQLRASLHPRLEHRHRARIEPYHPRAVPLPMHDADGASSTIDIRRLQRQGLADPKPTAVHDDQECPISNPRRRSVRRRPDQLQRFSRRHDLGREPASLIRRGNAALEGPPTRFSPAFHH